MTFRIVGLTRQGDTISMSREARPDGVVHPDPGISRSDPKRRRRKRGSRSRAAGRRRPSRIGLARDAREAREEETARVLELDEQKAGKRRGLAIRTLPRREDGRPRGSTPPAAGAGARRLPWPMPDVASRRSHAAAPAFEPTSPRARIRRLREGAIGPGTAPTARSNEKKRSSARPSCPGRRGGLVVWRLGTADRGSPTEGE